MEEKGRYTANLHRRSVRVGVLNARLPTVGDLGTVQLLRCSHCTLLSQVCTTPYLTVSNQTLPSSTQSHLTKADLVLPCHT